jgi:4-aminobutyrate aminotransferase-like enzyme
LGGYQWSWIALDEFPAIVEHVFVTDTLVGAVNAVKQDATDKIIFHATPRRWLEQAGPWVLERGEGALLCDADGREYLDALSGGVFAVLAG